MSAATATAAAQRDPMPRSYVEHPAWDSRRGMFAYDESMKLRPFCHRLHKILDADPEGKLFEAACWVTETKFRILNSATLSEMFGIGRDGLRKNMSNWNFHSDGNLEYHLENFVRSRPDLLSRVSTRRRQAALSAGEAAARDTAAAAAAAAAVAAAVASPAVSVNSPQSERGTNGGWTSEGLSRSESTGSVSSMSLHQLCLVGLSQGADASLPAASGDPKRVRIRAKSEIPAAWIPAFAPPPVLLPQQQQQQQQLLQPAQWLAPGVTHEDEDAARTLLSFTAPVSAGARRSAFEHIRARSASAPDALHGVDPSGEMESWRGGDEEEEEEEEEEDEEEEDESEDESDDSEDKRRVRRRRRLDERSRRRRQRQRQQQQQQQQHSEAGPSSSAAASGASDLPLPTTHPAWDPRRGLHAYDSTAGKFQTFPERLLSILQEDPAGKKYHVLRWVVLDRSAPGGVRPLARGERPCSRERLGAFEILDPQRLAAFFRIGWDSVRKNLNNYRFQRVKGHRNVLTHAQICLRSADETISAQRIITEVRRSRRRAPESRRSGPSMRRMIRAPSPPSGTDGDAPPLSPGERKRKAEP